MTLNEQGNNCELSEIDKIIMLIHPPKTLPSNTDSSYQRVKSAGVNQSKIEKLSVYLDSGRVNGPYYQLEFCSNFVEVKLYLIRVVYGDLVLETLKQQVR